MKNNFELNVKKWGEFRVGELFDFERGKRITKEFAELDENMGNIPVIGGGAENHGIFCHVNENLKNNFIYYNKCFTVSSFGSTGSIIYHNYNCFIDDKALALIPKEKLSLYACLFIETILNQEKYKYIYGRGIVESRYKDTIIKLPIDSRNNPDWQFMENYIKFIYEREREIARTSIKRKDIPLNVKEWKEFRIDRLFKVAGTKTTKIDDLEEYGTGNFPYITTQSTNNSVAGFYDYYTEQGNVLIIDSAVTGFCSYQEKEFSASDHVEKLESKFPMNKYIGLFISTIINSESYKYTYGRKFNQKRIKNTIIQLPVDNQNNPDWQFMENYIKQLPYSDKI
jgi:hypothetical protein